MRVKVYNKENELRLDGAGNPKLMHAVDAAAAEKSGNYRLVRETIPFGGEGGKRTIITECHEKTEEDFADDVEKKKALLKKQTDELEKAELELQEKIEAVNKKSAPKKKTPAPVVEENVPVLEEKVPLTAKKKK